MIELIDVSKYYVTDFGKHYVFRNVSLVLPPDRSVGVMGPNGAGKSTFLRLIAGADVPSEGSILRSGRISPPMGLTPGLQGSMTAAENARFAGRIYGLDRDEINDMIEYVRKTANIGKYFDEPVSEYSAGMKQRVSFAINMSMNFDYYLFDEISAGGDKEFRKMAKEMVLERLRTARFVLTSHRMRDLLEFCQSGIVIREGELTFFEDINDAVKFYGEDEDDDDESTSEKFQRRNIREERRRRREEERAGSATLSAPESVMLLEAPQQPVAAPHPEALPLKQDMLEAESASADSTGTEEDEEATKEQRRQKRKERRRARAALAEAVAQEAEDSDAETEVPLAHGAMAAVAPVILPDESDGEGAASDEQPRGRRRQRRAERERRKAEQAEMARTDTPLTVEADPSTETTATPSGDPLIEADDLDAGSREAVRAARRAAAEERRRQRRAERERNASTAPQTELEITTVAGTAPEQAGETAGNGWPATVETARVSDVMAEGSERTHLPATQPDESALTTTPAPHVALEPASIDNSSIWHAEASGEITGADRKLLLVRLLMRQERAQQKASRAARLLLQHLDAPVDESAQSRSGRAMLVKAAQDIAAIEAAAARGLLEQALAHEGGDSEAEPLPPSAPSPLSPENRWAT